MPYRVLISAGVVLYCALFFSSTAKSEWYAGGFGGMSTTGTLSDVTMNAYGERIAREEFDRAFDVGSATEGTVTQNFSASDLSLKSSPIFGAKAGYFFTDKGFPWLGIELEGFTTKPSFKAQTVNTHQDILYVPKQSAGTACLLPLPPQNCSESVQQNSQLSVAETDLRVTTVAFNVIARYSVSILQPYAGVGVGAFYFKGSGQFDGHQVVPGLNALVGLKVLATEEWGLFVEGKYNRANISNFDQTFGLSGTYSVFHLVTGLAYHF